MTAIGPWQVQTFSLTLALAILLAGAVALRQRPRPAPAVLDACLLALATGLLAARAGHLLLHLEHFARTPEDILRWSSGGLEWHSGLAGALAGLWLGARWRGLAWSALLDALTPAPALFCLGAWRGCMAAGCGYGREVDTLANHSPLLVAELPDIYGIVAPRYNTPLFGLLLAVTALLLAGLFHRRRWLQGNRFWLLTATLAAGMLFIGFWRADRVPQWGGLRSDQWLDLVVLSACLWPLRRVRRRPP
ncbi:MAG: prolipoprotein diacylglyceryl transferase [Anaerolineaceae bacterium]|nr:prolipoprotein diacylglyceryl transferase [Anaerolineaceae bacterium]MDE0328839.1 prolipoprotein diacylglyceryl transferase [Anaerolineaceae bacterium]